MNSKHSRTLAAVFADPLSPTIVWADIEGLLVAVGQEAQRDGLAEHACGFGGGTGGAEPVTQGVVEHARAPRMEITREELG
jgi:hypothetical protein